MKHSPAKLLLKVWAHPSQDSTFSMLFLLWFLRTHLTSGNAVFKTLGQILKTWLVLLH